MATYKTKAEVFCAIIGINSNFIPFTCVTRSDIKTAKIQMIRNNDPR